MWHERGVLPQDVLQSHWLGKFIKSVFQMQANAGSAFDRFGDFADCVIAVAG